MEHANQQSIVPTAPQIVAAPQVSSVLATNAVGPILAGMVCAMPRSVKTAELVGGIVSV